jgi:hypothetical protein
VDIVSLMLKVGLQIPDRSTLISDCLEVDREQDEEVTTHDCLAELAICDRQDFGHRLKPTRY